MHCPGLPLLTPKCTQRNRGLSVDLGPESETNLVSYNQSTYSTQCGCCSQLEFDFRARPPADCSGRGDSLSVSLVVSVGRPLLQKDTVGWDQTSLSAASSWGFLTGLSVTRAHLHRLYAQCPQD